MTYKLGQTIYVVKGNSVLPVLVVEEIVKKTLNGSEVAYIVKHKNNAPVPLTDVGTEAFEDAKSAKKTLIERATKAINAIIDEAQKNASEWYTTPGLLCLAQTKETSTVAQVNASCPIVPIAPENRMLGEDGCQIVSLPDGTKARIRMG